MYSVFLPSPELSLRTPEPTSIGRAVGFKWNASTTYVNSQLLRLTNSVVCFTGLGYLGMDGAQVLVYQPSRCQVFYEFAQLNFYCFSGAIRAHPGMSIKQYTSE